MTGVGIVGLGAALVNYKNAKKEYDMLDEQYEGMMAAVATYESNKLNAYIDSQDERPNDIPEGLLFSTTLRVGNLVGKMFRCQTSLVITNVSKQPYYVGYASAECNVLDCPVIVSSSKLLTEGNKQIPQEVNYGKYIAPGETVEIKMPAGISVLVDKETGDYITGKLRDMICEACGKKLITSCPKVTLEKTQKADILFKWREGETGELKVCNILGRLGALRYCGEAFYPG